MEGATNIELTSSSAFPKKQAFSYWADVVAQTFVPLQCDAVDRGSFVGELRHRKIGLVGVSEVRASAMIARRTKAKIAAAPRDDAIVVLQLAGNCNAGQDLQTSRLQPGAGAIVTAERPYFFEFPKVFRQLVIRLPRSLMADDRSDCGEPALLLSAGGARLLRKLALCSLDDASRLLPHEEAGIERAFADLVGAALLHSDQQRTGSDTSTRYMAACQFIRRKLADPALTPAAVAAHVNMSTRNLARLFSRQGTTIDRAIWSQRLIAARSDLLDPRLNHRSITEVAFSWGFGDAAHFSRRFSKAFGLSPSECRAASLSARSTPRC